ncbi:MAG: effector binding domain-containing protein [Bacteroidales bacterium]|nr:effector binding domain-containing protein [Bacteroidales bacterium]
MITNIIDKPAMNIVGLTLHTSFKNGRNNYEIPLFFHEVLDKKKLESVSNRLNDNQLCVFKMKDHDPDFEYIMGVEVKSGESIPDNMDYFTLPSNKYVALEIVKRGPNDVGNAFEYIYKKWIPNSFYIPAGEPAFIYYDNEFFDIYNKEGYSGNPKATIYVPIKHLYIKRLISFFRFRNSVHHAKSKRKQTLQHMN